MKKNTFETYIAGIKEKYEVEKKGIYADFLLNPSPAQLRELCLLLWDQGLSKRDENIFMQYFKVTAREALRNAIYNYHIPKFRTIGNFLIAKENKEERKSTSTQNANLIAVLVNFEPRPLAKFLESTEDYVTAKALENEQTGYSSALETATKTINTLQYDTPSSLGFTNSQNNTLHRNKIFTILGFITLILGIAFGVEKMFFEHKDCMIWKKDRYVEMDCDLGDEEILNTDALIPYQEEMVQFRRIFPTDTTQYFCNGKAVVWYCKSNEGSLELFNKPGFHPETNKPLKAITQNMIDKYLKK